MNTPLNTTNGTTFNCIIFIVPTNRYGHPHGETLERLVDARAKGRTDEAGVIEVLFRDEKVVLSEYGAGEQ